MPNKEEIESLPKSKWPRGLSEINDSPKNFYIKGGLPSLDSVWLCVVGSRKFTNYGKSACETLIEGLQGQDVVIVSGLALGIDSIAHQKALEVGLKTVAVPGSGLSEKVLTDFRSSKSNSRQLSSLSLIGKSIEGSLGYSL